TTSKPLPSVLITRFEVVSDDRIELNVLASANEPSMKVPPSTMAPVAAVVLAGWTAPVVAPAVGCAGGAEVAGADVFPAGGAPVGVAAGPHATSASRATSNNRLNLFMSFSSAVIAWRTRVLTTC